MFADYGGSCVAGWYCPAGTPKPIACTPGYVCTTTQLFQPNGDCPAGKFCPRGTATANGETCPAGHYCPQNSGEPIMCPAGRYRTSTGGTSLSDCAYCTAGYYCPYTAQTVVDTTNHLCDPGYICAAGSVHPRAALCPKGYRCVNGIQYACALDGVYPGTTNAEYQDENGATTCKQCPFGYECIASDGTENFNDKLVRCTPNL